MSVTAVTLSSSEESTTSRSVSVILCPRYANACKPNTSSGVGQELDIQDLQQQLLARDTDFEELQQQWNLQNFKFCLLVDMVSVHPQSSKHVSHLLKAVSPLRQRLGDMCI